MEAGRPRFVTALGASDEPGGWRPGKVDGGILIDVPTGEIVLRGLGMPHSPRLDQGWLWLLNSGRGELWRVDLRDFRAEVVAALPGFLRGLCLVGDHALIGLCKLREKSANLFGSLPIRDRRDRHLHPGGRLSRVGQLHLHRQQRNQHQRSGDGDAERGRRHAHRRRSSRWHDREHRSADHAERDR